jgi:hypothetical protein
LIALFGTGLVATVRRVAGWARRVRPGIDPGKAGRTAGRLASLARSALTGRAFFTQPRLTCSSTCSHST